MNRDTIPDDRIWMQRAIRLAMRGQGNVEPNPMVGCVMVRNGQVVGEGWHRRFGGPHAEINALRSAGAAARDATVYVSLEPCCHHGKTPPCTEALIAAGVRRVVVAMRDPFTKVSGRGLQRLRRAGVDVTAGVCQAEAIGLNRPYLKRLKTGQPWVILKWAQSLDGKIATRTGESKWITGEPARAYAHRIRGRVDAIIVGVNTIVADDPRLNCRYAKPRRVATRIVLDPHLRTPLRSQVVRSASAVPTLIVCRRAVPETARTRRLQKAGVEIFPINCRKQTGLDLSHLLNLLGERGMTNVMVEGGGKTLGSFQDAGLADEAVVFVAPLLIGGADAPSPLNAEGPARMADTIRMESVRRLRRGQDDIFHVLLK